MGYSLGDNNMNSSKNLWIAASDNNIDIVKELISSGKHTPNDHDPNGYTAMHAAASYGHHELLEYLIVEGGNINITDDDNETPLFVAEDIDTAKLLVKLGADTEFKNLEGLTAAEKLSREIEEDGEPYEDIVSYLRSLKKSSSSDYSKVDKTVIKDIQEMKYLLPKGTDVRLEFSEESEPLSDVTDIKEFGERRQRIEELIKSGSFEEGIKSIVEDAVRLQLSDKSSTDLSSTEPATRRRKIESAETEEDD
ncbi:ankyrin repeat-containing domain protein [Dipodascopsis uninucleata]